MPFPCWHTGLGTYRVIGTYFQSASVQRFKEVSVDEESAKPRSIPQGPTFESLCTDAGGLSFGFTLAWTGRPVMTENLCTCRYWCGALDGISKSEPCAPRTVSRTLCKFFRGVTAVSCVLRAKCSKCFEDVPPEAKTTTPRRRSTPRIRNFQNPRLYCGAACMQSMVCRRSYLTRTPRACSQFY